MESARSATCPATPASRRTGKQLKNYRPGEFLSGYVAYFVLDGASPMKATSYVERLAASRCKVASGDRLWCGTCHDPQRVPAQTKCLTCHEAGACQRGPDCVSCHMPKAQVIDGGHGVLTDHSIPRRPNQASVGNAENWKLHGFSNADTGGRELGLAYAEVANRTGDARQSVEALRLLGSLPRDPEINVPLAVLYEKQGNLKSAVSLYEDTLRRRPRPIVALVNLGRIYALTGKLEDAVRLWREALTMNPCNSEAALNLSIALKTESSGKQRSPCRDD